MLSKFSLQLQREGGYSRLEINSNSAQILDCAKCWHCLGRPIWHAAVSLTQPCMSHLAYANTCTSSGQAHQPRIHPIPQVVSTICVKLRITTLMDIPRWLNGSSCSSLRTHSHRLLAKQCSQICSKSVCQFSVAFFHIKFSSTEVISGAWANVELQKGRFPGYSLLYLSPIETAEIGDRAHSTRLTSLCLATTFLAWFP